MHAPGTIGDLVAAIAARLAAAGLENPRLDARFLVAGKLSLTPSALFANSAAMVTPPDAAEIEKAVVRRLTHEPVARILGRREFFGLEFKVTSDVLDPRPDTETLVNAALGMRTEFTGRPGTPSIRVLDLGTGSGCILLSILNAWPGATGLGIDISPAAIAVAEENANTLGLSSRAGFSLGNWCEGVSGTFDLIVSNPPYISSGEIPGLEPDVREFDPGLALDGGSDGLRAYRAIVRDSRRILAPGGRLILELGAGQGGQVAALAVSSGLETLALHPDLGGIPRCLVVRANPLISR